MSGIVSYGAYIPFNRLRREVVAEALGIRAGVGERAVASYDEDTVTMAVEATRAALEGADGACVQSLYFATTDPPYLEKLNAATIHAATNLPASVRALDLGCSVRAGLGSMLLASDCVAEGRSSLAAMADVRLGAPESSAELAGGDAAVAFVLGQEEPLAEIECACSQTLEYLATWRSAGQRFAKQWEERFALNQAYTPLLATAAKEILARAGIEVGDLAAVIVDTPNRRAGAALARELGLASEQLVDDMAATVGHTGTAHAGLMLASRLDTAKPGERILVLSVSDGVDAMMLRTTERIASWSPPHSVQSLIASKRNDLPYTRYLKWRGLLETEPPRRPDPQRPAAPPSLRTEHWKFGFMGSRCQSCGAYHLPPQLVCVACQTVGRMTEVSFADRKALIRTFAVDRLAFTPQPPMVVAMIDFEGGGRFQSELTDCEPEKVAIGNRVEMTFRNLFTADGVHNYFWKARPAR